jgi:hypothetical protein
MSGLHHVTIFAGTDEQTGLVNPSGNFERSVFWKLEFGCLCHSVPESFEYGRMETDVIGGLGGAGCSAAANSVNDFYTVAIAQGKFRVSASWHNVLVHLNRQPLARESHLLNQRGNGGATRQLHLIAIYLNLHRDS